MEQTDLKEGKKTKLEFESGVTVEGAVDKLLQPRWPTASDYVFRLHREIRRSHFVRSELGKLRHGVGDRITSVFNRRRDKDAYNQVALVPKERNDQSSIGREAQKSSRVFMRRCARFARRRKGYERLVKFGNAASRASRRLAVIDGNF